MALHSIQDNIQNQAGDSFNKGCHLLTDTHIGDTDIRIKGKQTSRRTTTNLTSGNLGIILELY
jgi:hypothetical protein